MTKEVRSSVFEHCQNNLLSIPADLFKMSDVEEVGTAGRSSIFYKDLTQDLVNIEFVSQLPCLVHVLSGEEVITSSSNERYVLTSGSTILFPAGICLYSDYVGKGTSLNAYLLFLGNDVVENFLPGRENIISNMGANTNDSPLPLRTSEVQLAFYQSLANMRREMRQSAELLKVKLIELLHLVALENHTADFYKRLHSSAKGYPRRNIKRLVEQYACSDLSVRDFATLSGRSLSSFNREFKRLFDTTPKQWLIDRRMKNAHELLVTGEHSVTQVAASLGYTNVSHFIEAFRKRYDTTPFQLRKEIDS